MYKLLYRIFGSLTLRCEGGFTGQFLELCRRSGVAFRNARCKENILYIEATPAELYTIRHIARETGMKVKILSRSGIVFTFNKYKKRYGMAVGFAVFTAIIFHLSGFIWNVEIAGESVYSQNEIIAVLKENSISVGKPLKDIEIATAKSDILSRLPQLKRVAISVDATTVTVEIADRVQGVLPTEPETEMPANIVASRDAYIVSVSPFAGESVVNIGDTVSKGQILVSGMYEDSVGRTYLTQAKGMVIGQTNRQAELKISLFNEETELTGEENQKISVFFFGLSINFFTKYRNQYTKCDIITENIQPTLFSKKLPIIITKTSERELEVEKRLLSQAELKEKIEDALKKYEQENIFGEIVSREINLETDDSTCTVNVNYVCLEEIGVKKEITFD